MESQAWLHTVDRLRGVDLAVVAIDGLAGSGKTMLIAGLAQIDVGRPVSIIQADCLVPLETGDWRVWTAREGYENYLDHARLEGEILIPLSEGRSVQYRPFNWTHRDYREPVTVEPVGRILVEGVFLLRPRLRRYWNFGIWVETGRELREDRLRGRGEHDEGWIDHWILAEDHYLQADVPKAAADVVVHGDRWSFQSESGAQSPRRDT